MIPSDTDDAIDSILNPSTARSLTADEDEFKRWKGSEPAAERGTEHTDSPIEYWVSMRDCELTLASVSLRLTYSLSQRQAVSLSACLVSRATS